MLLEHLSCWFEILFANSWMSAISYAWYDMYDMLIYFNNRLQAICCLLIDLRILHFQHILVFTCRVGTRRPCNISRRFSTLAKCQKRYPKGLVISGQFRAPWKQNSFWSFAWWRHQMETFSAILAICVGNSPATGGVPAQRPVMRSCDVFFDLRLNTRLCKQWWGWWFETPSRPSWRHCIAFQGTWMFSFYAVQAFCEAITVLIVGIIVYSTPVIYCAYATETPE